MVEYLYESGEPLVTGSHGNHDYVFASGEPVTDSGQSQVVYESGSGLSKGVGDFSIGGIGVQPFTTDESWNQWMDISRNDGTDVNADGWYYDEEIYPEVDNNDILIFFGESTYEDSYAVCYWGLETDGNGSAGFTVTLEGSDGLIDPNPGAFDMEASDNYGTRSDGDIYIEQDYNLPNGDSGVWEIQAGGTIDFHFEGGHSGDPLPEEVRVLGPDTSEVVATNLSAGDFVRLTFNG